MGWGNDINWFNHQMVLHENNTLKHVEDLNQLLLLPPPLPQGRLLFQRQHHHGSVHLTGFKVSSELDENIYYATRYTFPATPWTLTSIGCTLTYTWVILHLWTTLDKEVRGHSLQSGGATALALASVSDDVIQSMGWWASDTFWIYIRKHPVLLHTLIHNKATLSMDE